MLANISLTQQQPDKSKQDLVFIRKKRSSQLEVEFQGEAVENACLRKPSRNIRMTDCHIM
jgi:hypothetical protein